MEAVTKIELIIYSDKAKKPQLVRRIIPEIEKLLSKPLFKDGDVVSIKEVR